MTNITPPTPALAVKDWMSLEITRDGSFMQAIGTTRTKSALAPGQVVELGLPHCKRLIVQSVNKDRVSMGCWLSVYLNAKSESPETKLTRKLGDALKAMLTARGIPLEEIAIDNTGLLGAIPRVGNDPEEVAIALGYILYCNADLKVKLAPQIPQGFMVGSFTEAELASLTPGQEGPLSANRVVAKGDLITTRSVRGKDPTVTKDRVSTGWRTTTKGETVRGRVHTVTEVILEPPSEISRFSAQYEKTQDPYALIANFTQSRDEPAIRSQTSTIDTYRDSKGYIVKRERTVEGCAAKGLSSFYSAWAGADLPEPDSETAEPEPEASSLEEGTTTIIGGGNFVEQQKSKAAIEAFLGKKTDFGSEKGAPLTLLRPSGMFVNVTLLSEVETWDFTKERVTYTREQLIPMGAIIPEVGNPIFGYQTPSERSSPTYHNPLPLFLAEKEVVKWEKDDLDRWESRRSLSQAKGVRNAQEPRDAMSAVKFEGVLAETVDRSFVAIAVATQLTVVASSVQFSTPPGPSPIEEMQEVETSSDYEVVVELEGDDLLDRSYEISPSPFTPNLEQVRKAAQYAALELRGQSNSIKISLPLADLPYDIPPNSALELEGKRYLVSRVSSNQSSASGVLSLDLWPL